MRVGFAGTPEFAAIALRRLRDTRFEVPLVLTQPDRPAGRGLKLQPSAVKQVALQQGLPVVQPRSLRLDGKFPDDAAMALAALQQAALDVLVVAAYGLILPQWVLDLPRRGCLNIHASLLPRWRGAAPIQRAIEAGDARTGITIMQMDAGLDTGDMLMHEAVDIGPQDTAASLHDRLAPLGGRLLVEALEAAACGRLQPTSQLGEGVTYAHKIEKAEAAIDWQASAAQIERRVRAFDPFPGAHFRCADETLKVWRAQARPALSGAPGVVLQAEGGTLVVASGEGSLELLELQRPGGRRQPAAALLQALAIGVGQRLAD